MSDDKQAWCSTHNRRGCPVCWPHAPRPASPTPEQPAQDLTEEEIAGLEAGMSLPSARFATINEYARRLLAEVKRRRALAPPAQDYGGARGGGKQAAMYKAVRKQAEDPAAVIAVAALAPPAQTQQGVDFSDAALSIRNATLEWASRFFRTQDRSGEPSTAKEIADELLSMRSMKWSPVATAVGPRVFRREDCIPHTSGTGEPTIADPPRPTPTASSAAQTQQGLSEDEVGAEIDDALAQRVARQTIEIAELRAETQRLQDVAVESQKLFGVKVARVSVLPSEGPNGGTDIHVIATCPGADEPMLARLVGEWIERALADARAENAAQDALNPDKQPSPSAAPAQEGAPARIDSTCPACSAVLVVSVTRRPHGIAYPAGYSVGLAKAPAAPPLGTCELSAEPHEEGEHAEA